MNSMDTIQNYGWLFFVIDEIVTLKNIIVYYLGTETEEMTAEEY